jgi:ribosomal protein S18 acetylase RimI-like enzyme
MNSYFNNKSAFILKNMDATGKISGCVYLEKMGTAMYLGMLTVSPELQAKGIGRALLHEAEAFAKTVACTMIRMTVITSRSELISYYERRGFYKTGQVFPFHHDEKFGIPKQHIELLVMEKKLDDSSLINQDNK